MQSRPKLLYLVHRVPCPPDKGDRIRAYHILRFLQKHANVHLACLADEPVAQSTIDELNTYCENVAIIPVGRFTRWPKAAAALIQGKTITEGAFRSAGLRRIIKDWTASTRFDGVMLSASSMLPYLQLECMREIPAVVDLVDVDSQKWFDYSHSKTWPWSWLYRTEGQRLRKLEQQLPASTRAVTLVSEAEANIYRQFATVENVHAITNGVDLDYFRNPNPDAEAEKACVFVGAFDYYPNIDAAIWFCNEVWPQVHQKHADAKFYLVGRRPVPEVTRLANIPGVEVVGGVPDVRPHLARAAVSVNPLRIARGLQNKVLEALAMQKAVVAPPAALAALHTEPNVHLLEATTPQEWVQSISKLLEEKSLRQRLGNAGREYVEEHHDWDSCLNPLAVLLHIASPQQKRKSATAESMLASSGES